MADLGDEFMNFGKPEKNAGSHQSNESDDFEQVDPYQVQEHPEDDDFLITSGNQDYALGSHMAGLHSTDRPLVTFEETSPSAPPAPPSLSTVSESMKFDEEPEYERQYSQPSPKHEKQSSNFEPESRIIAEDKYDLPSFNPKQQHNSGLDYFSEKNDTKPDPYVAVCPQAPVVEDIIKATPAPPKMESIPTSPLSETPSPSPQPAKQVATEEAEACTCPFRAWFNPQNLDPRVVDLVYWRDPKKTGIVFGGVLLVLLSLTYFSLITVVAYLTLAVLAVTLTFRIYRNVLAAVQKSNEGHPFKKYLEQDLVISNDQIQEITQSVVVHLNAVAHELRRLILVEDLVDSIKFGVMMWCLTYVGGWFNGMTLLILAWVAIFTLPKVYETNKTQIDHYLGIVHTQVNDIISKIKAKIPIGKKVKEQ